MTTHIFRIWGDELRSYAKFHRPATWVAPDASPPTKDIPACRCAPQTSTRTSLSVTSSGVLRSACCCFQSSTRTPVRTSLSMTSTWLHIWRTFRSFMVVLSVFVYFASFLFLIEHDGYTQKKTCKIHFLPPSSDQQNHREKIDCFRQISNWDHKKRGNAPQSPRNSACRFSSWWSTTRLLHKKNIRTPAWL